MLTDADLDRLEAFAAKATPGPWGARGTEVFSPPDLPDPIVIVDTRFFNEPTNDREREDAEFIAEARTALPLLIEELRRGRTRIGVLQEILDEATLENQRLRGLHREAQIAAVLHAAVAVCEARDAGADLYEAKAEVDALQHALAALEHTTEPTTRAS